MVRREPDYPASAIRRRIEGEVVVEVAIDPTGSVSGATVLQSSPAGVFDDAVLRAVRRWRYRVSGASDEAGCDRTQVRLRFELPPGTR
jgi:protein TonB